MNSFNDPNDPNDQYRRPQRHTDGELIDVRPTIDRRQLLGGCAMLLGLAVLMVIGLTPRTASAPESQPNAAQVQSDLTLTTTADCQLLQHLTYAPCGHSLTRRQVIPTELTGQNRITVAAAYADWQITSFAPGEVEMARTLALYCPEHVVLMPDESGFLCIFRNKYGDALGLVEALDLPLSELPDAIQDEIRPGKGFNTQEELEKWLESVDS